MGDTRGLGTSLDAVADDVVVVCGAECEEEEGEPDDADNSFVLTFS